MGQDSFDALSDLFARHPEVSDMRASPDPAVLDAFEAKLRTSSYVQGLFEFGNLRVALDALEAEYQKLRERSVPRPSSGAVIERYRKEREVRFILRLAAVLGPAYGEIKVPSDAEQKVRQQELVDSLKAARGKLAELLRDEFFREGLATDWQVAVLRRMLDDMAKAESWLGIETYRPVHRIHSNAETSTAPTRQIANRLADACFRIYANCDATILKSLLSYPWLQGIAKRAMTTLIQEALERKVDQFGRKLPNEDYVAEDLFGAWLVSRDIDPPWMRD